MHGSTVTREARDDGSRGGGSPSPPGPSLPPLGGALARRATRATRRVRRELRARLARRRTRGMTARRRSHRSARARTRRPRTRCSATRTGSRRSRAARAVIFVTASSVSSGERPIFRAISRAPSSTHARDCAARSAGVMLGTASTDWFFTRFPLRGPHTALFVRGKTKGGGGVSAVRDSDGSSAGSRIDPIVDRTQPESEHRTTVTSNSTLDP